MTDDPSDRRDPYQKEAAENERSDRPQYHHDATKGETRYPPSRATSTPAIPASATSTHG
jgi:hypothetical protein